MTKKHKIEAVLYHLFVCLFGLLMIYPVLCMISGSLWKIRGRTAEYPEA